MDKDFHKDFSEKNLCENLCSVRGPLIVFIFNDNKLFDSKITCPRKPNWDFYWFLKIQTNYHIGVNMHELDNL